MESPSRVQLDPITTQLGSFFYTAASSMPIRVVTREVRYIHKLSLTLEYSMPISSPAAPGLTSPRALRSRVLQASSVSEDVCRVLRELLDFRCKLTVLRVHQVLRVVFQVLLVASSL